VRRNSDGGLPGNKAALVALRGVGNGGSTHSTAANGGSSSGGGTSSSRGGSFRAVGADIAARHKQERISASSSSSPSSPTSKGCVVQ
jgi:hypothetical protein